MNFKSKEIFLHEKISKSFYITQLHVNQLHLRIKQLQLKNTEKDDELRWLGGILIYQIKNKSEYFF